MMPVAFAFFAFISNRWIDSNKCCCGQANAFVKAALMSTGATQQVLGLAAMQDLSKDGVRVLSNDPLVYMVDNLLSKEECIAYQLYTKQLEPRRPLTLSNPPEVTIELKKLWPLIFLSGGFGIPTLFRGLNEGKSLVIALEGAVLPAVLALTLSISLAYGLILPLMKKRSRESSRTSCALALNEEEDVDLVRGLVNDVSCITKHRFWEAPVISRYDPGAVFKRHGDASPMKGKEWQGQGGQRVVTCICYLNEPEGGGGETYFDKLDIAVNPKTGSALVFFPADSLTWESDARTTHESLPRLQDAKWIVQLFGRAERVPPPLGLPVSFCDGLHDVSLGIDI